MGIIKIVFVGLCAVPFVFLAVFIISKSIDDVLKK